MIQMKTVNKLGKLKFKLSPNILESISKDIPFQKSSGSRVLSIEILGITNVGGIAGMMNRNTKIENSVFSGIVRGVNNVGGAIGYSLAQLGNPLIINASSIVIIYSYFFKLFFYA